MSKILITGVGGNVGQFLAQELSKEYDVVGVYHNQKPQDAQYDLIQADLATDKLDLYDVEVVIHAAAGLNGSALSLTQNNIIATLNLLNECEKACVRKFIYLSTVSVYGKTTSELSEESDYINPEFYGVTKYVAEKLVIESAISQKLVIQLPRMLGPFVDLYHSKGSGFIMMARKLIEDENITCYIPNVCYNNFMHVADLVFFLEMLFKQNKWKQEFVLLGSNERKTMACILEIMKYSIESNSFILVEENGAIPACSEINIQKALEMGYHPMKVEECLCRFMKEMKNKYIGV